MPPPEPLAPASSGPDPQAALPSLGLMALVVGLSVANPFYAQALLPAVQRAFAVAPGSVLLGPMATQLGMGLGFLFVLPLGDIRERRRMLTLLALGMAFDRDGETLSTTLEAAHSHRRVLHAQDRTGGALVEALERQVAQRPGLERRSGVRALQLWVEAGR